MEVLGKVLNGRNYNSETMLQNTLAHHVLQLPVRAEDVPDKLLNLVKIVFEHRTRAAYLLQSVLAHFKIAVVYTVISR